MRHRGVRPLPDKDKVNEQLKTSEKNWFANKFTADSKNLNHCSKRDGKQKMKRLKTRKERSLVRGGWKETSNTKSHHHYCSRHSSKDMAHFHNCCHSSCHCPSKKQTQFPGVAPATQEPSIITDSRLIGHKGLFNHEVKSIDIERLLSEQRNLKQSVKEKYKASSHLSSSSCIPAHFSCDRLLGPDTDEAVPSKKKTDAATKADCDSQEKENQNLQFNSEGLDVTPGQRPQQQPDRSSGSFNSMHSSKHSSLSLVPTKTIKTNNLMCEKDIESQLTPIVGSSSLKTLNKKVQRKMIPTLELTAKTLEFPVYQKQTSGLNPSPFQLQSSPTADSFDVQCRRQNPKNVSKSVSAVAVRLCDSLDFLHLGRANLLSESREVLLKSLREKHGPWLQENLLEVQRSFSIGMDPTNAVQDQEIRIDEHEILPSDMSFTMKGSKTVNWKFSPQPHHNVEQFFMDFEPSGPSASEGFTPSLTLCREERASERWENSFNRSTSKESVTFDFFENSFVNCTSDRKRRSGLQCRDHNIQPFFSHKAQLADTQPAEPTYFPQKQDPLTDNKYSFSPLFPAKIPHFSQSNSLFPFSEFLHPLACSPPRSHHTDMVHYPPSQMLERSTTPLSCLLSPVHWSFPAMRLY
ncbi:uncharacterized protein si:dkey-250k15.4 [Acanthochromis polyacanthus]|uniref:uncharacterized protein si:dkey-250k15.4 n=1 Tax=Acanthochromis polyacanthus TaxID=80966 RepID=UPI0022347445|nr:uncharacterized protein si:dkey-250k15.4 [Acanthochromis polyacanthus]